MEADVVTFAGSMPSQLGYYIGVHVERRPLPGLSPTGLQAGDVVPRHVELRVRLWALVPLRVPPRPVKRRDVLIGIGQAV